MDNDNSPILAAQPETPTGMGQSTLPPAKTRGRKGFYILLGVVVLIGALAALWYVRVDRQSDKILATISLSNQKELHIGQTAKDAALALGYSDLPESVNILEYPIPIDLEHPLEATVYLHEGRVIGVRINRNDKNIDKQTGIYPGMTLEDVKIKTNDQIRSIVQVVKYGRAIGLVKEDSKTMSYYLVNACAPEDDKVRVIVVVEKGFEERALELGAGCNGRGN